MLYVESRTVVVASGLRFFMTNVSATNLLVLSKLIVSRKQSLLAIFETDANLFVQISTFFRSCLKQNHFSSSPSSVLMTQFWCNPIVSFVIESVVWKAIVILSIHNESSGLHSYFPSEQISKSHISNIIEDKSVSYLHLFVNEISCVLLHGQEIFSCLESVYPRIRSFALWFVCEMSIFHLKSQIELNDSALQTLVQTFTQIPSETLLSRQIRKRLESAPADLLYDVLITFPEKYSALMQTFGFDSLYTPIKTSSVSIAEPFLTESSRAYSLAERGLSETFDAIASLAEPLTEIFKSESKNNFELHSDGIDIEQKISLLLFSPDNWNELRDALLVLLENNTVRSIVQICMKIFYSRHLITELLDASSSYAGVLLDFLISALKLTYLALHISGLLPPDAANLVVSMALADPKNFAFDTMSARINLLQTIFELEPSSITVACSFVRNCRSQLTIQPRFESNLQLFDMFIIELKKRSMLFQTSFYSSDQRLDATEICQPGEFFSSAQKQLSHLLPSQLKLKALQPITQFLSEESWYKDDFVLKWIPIFVSLVSSDISYGQVDFYVFAFIRS